MQALRQASLTLQIPLLAAAVTLVVSCGLVWLAATSSHYLLEQREQAYGKALAQQVVADIVEPLQRGDLLSVRASLQRFVDQSPAAAIRITDVVGLPMGEAGAAQALELRAFRADIRIGNDVAGEVLVALDLSPGTDQQRFLFSLLALALALSLVVFLLTRYLAQRLATTLLALQSQLQLPTVEENATDNELWRLHHTVEQLPIDMLRGHAAVPPAAQEFRDAALLYVHLVSLARYVNTLSESNLHRYTRRVQQLLNAAAQCYRGELTVTRPFGLVITFAPQSNAGSEALRAASCARLIALVATGLEERTNLSLDLAMALGHCELVSDGADDMYPELYLQGSIDELRASCLTVEDFPTVLVVPAVLDDPQLGNAAALQHGGAGLDPGTRELLHLSEEQEALLAHQAQLIVERIKPMQPATPS
jgi:hypothetical protein